MSVYLNDSKVLLDSGNVATDSACCCAGVCCQCDGTCDDTVTQQECEDGGGQWFGNDNCDDPPCVTGACCVGTDCFVKTQDCCEAGGGDYQGDGTTCDPNPCTIPSCDGCSGFEGFMGSGLRYFTKDYYKTLTSTCKCQRLDQCQVPQCTNTWHVHEEYDPVTCGYSTSQTGYMAHLMGCKFPEECCDPFDPTCTGGVCSDFGDCGFPSGDIPMDGLSFLCFGVSNTCGLTPDSDSHSFCEQGYTLNILCDCDEGGSDIVITEEIILSNPCTP